MIHLLTGCSSKQNFLFHHDADALELAKADYPLPDTRFFVISDTHLYDTSLGTSGAAFQKYLDGDRKLLELSNEIIDTTTREIAAQPGDFVIVCGDLTKDGEMICHKGMVPHLNTLKASGKKVFVVPGNHDLRNRDAVRFIGDRTEPVPSAEPEDFERIYHDFGYGQALARDEDSLSYVAEPVEGLWLLALDSCRWKENTPDHHPITSGAFSPQTMNWIEQQLIGAKQAKKSVIAMQHHGIMEHYPANKKFYDQYIISDYEVVSELLATYGVSLVFTGHFHAQDITQKTIKSADRSIFDIETGSLVTAPCPYRQITFSNGNRATIKSSAIESIPSMETSFSDHADQYVFDGTKKLVDAALAKYKVSPEKMDLINHQVARAYTAHLKGDEIYPANPVDTKSFGVWLKFISWLQEDLVIGWWTDLPPQDNDLVIKIDTGEVSKA